MNELVLEVADLLESSDKENLQTIYVDKDVFDDYVENAVVDVRFVDCKFGEGFLFSYQMIEETEDAIKMVCI